MWTRHAAQKEKEVNVRSNDLPVYDDSEPHNEYDNDFTDFAYSDSNTDIRTD